MSPVARGYLVQLAREARGRTQKGVAEALGITQGMLSKIENGLAEATPEVISDLCAFLEFPPEVFLFDLRVRELPVHFYRKRATTPKKSEKTLRARINFLRLRVRQLLRSVELPELSAPRFDLAEFDEDETALCDELRSRWQIPPGPIKNLTEVVEDAGILVVPLNLGTKKIDGLSIYAPEDDLPPMVFLSTEIPCDRWRYTLAHEVGHILLHHHRSVYPDATDTEAEADRFARELLMPAAEVRKHLVNLTMQKLASLKPYWRAAMSALLYRARELATISEPEFERLSREMTWRGYWRNEPVDISRERPEMFEELTNYYRAELGYSEAELREFLLCINSQDFDEIVRPARKLRAV